MTQRLLILLCCLLLSRAGLGQAAVARPPAARADSLILAKTFPLLALFEAKPALRQVLWASPDMQRVAQQQARRSAPLLAQAALPRYVDSLVWQPREIRQVSQLLQQAYATNAAFRVGVVPLFARPGRYPRYADQPDTTALRLAWQDAAAGINRILRVYLASAKPRYPAIDSTGFRRGDAGLAQQLRQLLPASAKASKTALFYTLPLQVALGALRLNGRDEAARYEPLTGGLNTAPAAAVARTEWARYPYTVILVPGSGPELPGVALDSSGAMRCRLAAARYRAGQAPFVVVSGGHVHPFRTPYCEAVEMKKYMVEQLHLPAAAVFIEPHARHTTTNLRNTARLLNTSGFPLDRPMLIVTDAAQSRSILAMAGRCQRELGYVPYRDLQRISETENSCYPMPEAGQPDPFDPLDP